MAHYLLDTLDPQIAIGVVMGRVDGYTLSNKDLWYLKLGGLVIQCQDLGLGMSGEKKGILDRISNLVCTRILEIYELVC
jgi:hypothetical protein